MDTHRTSFATRLVAFACVENFFRSSFCTSLVQRVLMPGLTFSNELISRDEALHTNLQFLLYSKLNNKLEFELISHIIKEAVEP